MVDEINSHTEVLKKVITDHFLSWDQNSFKASSDYNFSLSTLASEELAFFARENSGISFIEDNPIPPHETFPTLTQEISIMRHKFLESGYGFVILNGMLSKEFTRLEKIYCFWLICNIIGIPLDQNIKKEILVEVKDNGQKIEEGGRYHNTNQGGSLHTDCPQWETTPNYVGLYCVKQAASGGESKLANAISLHNYILINYPELLPILYDSFHFDKRGEFIKGESPSTFSPIFSYNNQELHFRYLRDYIDSGHYAQPLTTQQNQALKIIDDYLKNEKFILTLYLEQGQMLFLNNNRVIHGRNSYQDDKEQNIDRLMLRMWLKYSDLTSS